MLVGSKKTANELTTATMDKARNWNSTENCFLTTSLPSIHPSILHGALVGAGSHAHMHKSGPGDRGGGAHRDGGGGEDQNENKNKNKSGFIRRGVRNWEDGEKLKVCGEGASMHASGQHNLPSSCSPPTSLILLTCTFPQVGNRKHTRILRSRSRSRSE